MIMPKSCKVRSKKVYFSFSKKSQRCPHCERDFTNLKHHINQQHSGLKNYACGDCGYSCYLKTDLERHVMTVHDKHRTPCQICGKQYSDLRQHVRLVHEARKLICPECNKGYTNLSQHIAKVHRKTLSEMCEQCGQTFQSPAKLRKHEKKEHEPQNQDDNS